MLNRKQITTKNNQSKPAHKIKSFHCFLPIPSAHSSLHSAFFIPASLAHFISFAFIRLRLISLLIPFRSLASPSFIRLFSGTYLAITDFI
jgi:hypothetical protein